MEVYSNENEQREAVKQFFSENGKALVVGVVLGVAALIGWRYWGSSQETAARETSQKYDTVLSSLQANNAAGITRVESFIKDNSNTYGALASLSLAHQLVEKNEIGKADEQLKQGLNDTKDDNLKAIINLRLARLQIQQQQGDAALKTLEGVKGEGWSAIVADLRGEALLSKGDKQGARQAWSKGVDSDASPALREMMKMKINNLSS